MSKSTYTPIRARRGRKIHAIATTDLHTTLCERPCAGWVLALPGQVLDCERCLDVAGRYQMVVL